MPSANPRTISRVKSGRKRPQAVDFDLDKKSGRVTLTYQGRKARASRKHDHKH